MNGKSFNLVPYKGKGPINNMVPEIIKETNHVSQHILSKERDKNKKARKGQTNVYLVYKPADPGS